MYIETAGSTLVDDGKDRVPCIPPLPADVGVLVVRVSGTPSVTQVGGCPSYGLGAAHHSLPSTLAPLGVSLPLPLSACRPSSCSEATVSHAAPSPPRREPIHVVLHPDLSPIRGL